MIFWNESQSSFVDVSNNFANLASVNLTDDLADFFDGDIRVYHLLTLLHEVTHHWSLTTFVGTALSAHILRVHAYAAELAEKGELSFEKQLRMEHSAAVSRIAQYFLAPLFEGLALFAEWRLLPSGRFIYSRPLALAEMLTGSKATLSESEKDAIRDALGGISNASDDDYQRIVDEFSKSQVGKKIANEAGFRLTASLLGLRSEASYIERKASLFEKSIDPTRDPYQIGYLFLCGLACARPTGCSTDQFLSFVKDFFLNDIELAMAIFAESSADVYSRMRKRLQDRSGLFFTDPKRVNGMFKKWDADTKVTRAVGKTFENYFSSSHNLRHLVELDLASFARCEDDFRARIDDLAAGVDAFGIDEAKFYSFLFAGRLAMPVKGQMVRVAECDDDFCTISTGGGGKLKVKLSLLDRAPSVGEALSLVLVFNVLSLEIGVCLVDASGVSVLPFSGEDSSFAAWREIFSYYREFSELRGAANDLLGRIRIVSGEDGTSRGLYDGADLIMRNDSGRKDIEQIYRFPIVQAFSLDHPAVQDRAWREGQFRLWGKYGVASVFDNPADLLRFVSVSNVTARLHTSSIDETELEATAAEIDSAFMRAFYRQDPAEYNNTCDELSKKSSSLGLRLFSDPLEGMRFSLV